MTNISGVTEVELEAALLAVANLKRARYRLPATSLETLKAAEQQSGHWELLLEETRAALTAALTLRDGQSDLEAAGNGTGLR